MSLVDYIRDVWVNVSEVFDSDFNNSSLYDVEISDDERYESAEYNGHCNDITSKYNAKQDKRPMGKRVY